MSEYWKIPEEHNAEFVARMEDVLDVYQRPYSEDYPVVCMDESPKQIIGEVRNPIPMKPGCITKVDDEYERRGTAELLLAVEPLTGRLIVKVEEQRTKKDWAKFIKFIVDEQYPAAKKIVLIMDNLNTHKVSSLYENFCPEEAHRIANKLEIHFTPKHGSWLNVAEIGFSLLKRLCIPDRVDSIEKLRAQVTAFVERRNSVNKGINWHFKTEDAREKLKHLYPEL